MSVSDDRRFDATPSRRERAKREGNAPRSAELSGIVAFAAAALAAGAVMPFASNAAASAVRDSAAHRLLPMPSVFALTVAALVPCAAAACAGGAVALAQAGGLHVNGVHLDFKRLDPMAGAKRMFGAEAAVGAARAALALVAACFALIPIARDLVGASAALAAPGPIAATAVSAIVRACCAVLAVGAAFALADYALARRRWLRGIRMSAEELKRDAKENDGDPQARARRKSIHRAVTRGSIARTREASFVVVNPTHVAVALRYAPPEILVPQILVRALDDAAQRVKAIAREHAIPLVEDVALARLLYAQGEAGRAIPADAYVAVAQIVAALAREGLA